LTSTDTQMRLLIIEDDRESADYLVKAFREVGYVADLASDGEEGLALADTGDYDVLVIDRMLPKRDGLSLIGTLRDKGNRTPALILSALGQVDDRIKGLRAGGDDYLPKPYSFAELRAAGAHVGSGSIVATGANADVLELAELLTRFCAGEACGKTIPCRIGTRRIEEIATRINAGTPRPTDADLLVDLSADIVASALCDHERLTTLPMTSVMRYFRPELDAKLQSGAEQTAGRQRVAVAGGERRTEAPTP